MNNTTKSILFAAIAYALLTVSTNAKAFDDKTYGLFIKVYGLDHYNFLKDVIGEENCESEGQAELARFSNVVEYQCRLKR